VTRRDDACRDGVGQPERVADRQHPIADLQMVGVAEWDARQLAFWFDLEQRDVGLGVLTDELRLELLPGRELHVDVVGAVDDVTVGDDVAAVVDHESGAETALLRRRLAPTEALPEILAEELLERVLTAWIRTTRGTTRNVLGGVDVDDCRHDLLRETG